MSRQHLSVNETRLTFPFAVGASHFGHSSDEPKIRICLFQALENIQKGCIFRSPIGIEQVQLVGWPIVIGLADDTQKRRDAYPACEKNSRLVIAYARIAVGAAFLSAVASRLGLWDRTLDLKHFANFIAYAAEVNSFLPSAVIPYVAVLATVCETLFGILLLLGLWPRWISLGSAVLLVLFGTAMAISFGIKSPMDYSVFSASGASVLLALDAFRRKKSQAVD